MKKLLSASLVLTSLVSLTACGGRAQIVPTAYPYAQNAYGQNAYLQSGYAYQTPQQQAPDLSNISSQLPTAYNPQITQQSMNQGVAAPQQRNSMNTPAQQAVATPNLAAANVPQQQRVAPNPAQPAQAQAPQAAPQQAAPQSPDAVVQNLLKQSAATFDAMQNYKAIASVHETNEKGTTDLKLNVIFQKPGRSKMEILEHNNSLYVGVKLTYQSGTNQVTGRPSGMLGFVKMTVPMTDDRILTRRGYRLDQVDTLAIVNRLIKSGQTPRLLGKTTVAGRQVAVLEYTPKNHFDPAITRELLGIDLQDHFVRIHEMYAGKQLVYSLKLEQVQVNAPLTDKDFEV